MASKTLEGTRVAFWLTASRKQQLFTNKQDRAIAFYYSHKKRKDNLKCSLGRLLFPAKFEFQTKNTSTQATSFYCILSFDKPLEVLKFLFCCSDINIFSIDYAQWELCNI